MVEKAEELETTSQTPEEGDPQSAEETEAATSEQETAEATEEGADTKVESQDPETVPYARFKEVYASYKQAERELEESKHHEVQPKVAPVKPVSDSVKPKVNDFENYEDFQEALTDYKLDERDAQKRAEQEQIDQRAVQRDFDDQISVAEAKDPQFRDNGYIPEGIVPFLTGTKKLVEFAYHFGANPGEARRILSLPATQAARELGALEAGFNGPQQKTRTSKVAATKPIDGVETLEKDPSDMSNKEYRAWRNNGGGR